MNPPAPKPKLSAVIQVRKEVSRHAEIIIFTIGILLGHFLR